MLPVFIRRFLLLLALLTGPCTLAAAPHLAWSQAPQPTWETVDVPAVWRKPSPGLNGYSWYRCYVTLPETWRGRDLEIFAEPSDKAQEIYLNGAKVGGAGDFPPQFRSGLGADERFQVSAAHARFDPPNVFAIRVYDNFGRTGFNVAAPVIFGGDQAVRLEGKWQHRAGDDAAWATELDGSQVAGVLYSTVQPAAEVARSLKRLQGDEGALSPEESLRRMSAAQGLSVEVALADPEIGQPLSMKFDERGRLWVVQYLQYPNPAGLKMVSRDQHLRTVYDKVPPAPPHHFRGNDKITIHEDADGDGRYERQKTFVEGLSLVSSFAPGRGGLWVLNPPYLLFYPDRNHDDVPDGDPEVHLEGFGIEDSHSLANSLRWGPDGWLYSTQGSTVSGEIKRPGLDKQGVHSMGQLVWRYQPETRRYEIFAEGGGNSFGLEIDSKGRIYSGHNGNDTRGFHYIQGGYFQKGFDKHGALSNPFTFGYFLPMTHHKAPRFTHTFVIYEGAALPDEYRGQLFGVFPLQSQVVRSVVETDRSSFKTHDLPSLLTTTDSWCRPVDIQVGPDGAMYVADLYEQRIDHSSHYQGRIDRSTGRIYRIRAQDAKHAPAFDLAKRSSHELIEVLKHENKWHRQTALRLLADRRDASILPELRRMIENAAGQPALEALWAIYLTGGLSNELALRTLDHSDPFVRLWTVRLLCDERSVSPPVAHKLAALAGHEPNLEARVQLACSARRLPVADALPIVRNLLARDEDVADIYQPLSVWWAIEAHAKEHRDQVVAMFSDRAVWELPLVQEHILTRLMRRYAAAGSRKDLLTCARLLELAPTAEHAKRLMTGFEQAFEGRPLSGLPEELLAAMAKAGGGSLALRVRQKESAAVDEALAVIADEQKPVAERTLYLQVLGEIDEPRSVPAMLKVVEQSRDDTIRAAALTALQSYDEPQIATAVISVHDALSDDLRLVAQTLLASRRGSSLAVLQAVDSKRIDPALIPPTIVRKILFHRDEPIASLVRKHWGEIQGATTEAMREQIDRLVGTVYAGSGSPYDGAKLFAQHCAKCHTLFGDGGSIGPDLTGYNRQDLPIMLLNVVNPSASIREGFENYVAVTTDGRTLNGFVADQDGRTVVLRGIDGQNLILPREEIEELAAIPQSIMPEGILNPLTEQQVRDLFAYLRMSQPLPGSRVQPAKPKAK